MIENPYVYQFVFFVVNFLSILATLLFYTIFLWVISSWFIMFGLMTPQNRLFQYLTQLVAPVLKPFQWAKIGMIDLSPIAAILVLDLVMNVLQNGLAQLIS